MNNDARQSFRPDIPYNVMFPVSREDVISYVMQDAGASSSVSNSQFRKRRSEDMENRDRQSRSLNVVVPSPSPCDGLLGFDNNFNGNSLSWDLCAPMPAHMQAVVPSQYQQQSSYRVPGIFYDQLFWQRYHATHGSDSNVMDALSAINSESNRSVRPAVQTQRLLLSPLPPLNWADRCELWENMLRKDVTYARSPTCLARHPTILPKMRSILLSWMTEVCEAYKLHRETYYLAIDFLDRFLAASKQEIIKNNLQLVGITTLFIAAKIEEIYPPKIREFAYVTDGACLVEEIKRMELIILGTLDWQLCPLTVVGWLSTLLQVAYLSDMSGRELSSVDVIMPKYSRDFFTSMAQILDACILDLESLRFPYSHLAASAMFHLSNRSIVQSASGISIDVLQPCIEWMRPFVEALFERGFTEPHFFDNVSLDEQHTIQNHSISYEILDRVQKKIKEKQNQPQSHRHEQRDLFANMQPGSQWQSFAQSPMRSSNHAMPLTPLCTPPDAKENEDSYGSQGLMMKQISMHTDGSNDVFHSGQYADQ